MAVNIFQKFASICEFAYLALYAKAIGLIDFIYRAIFYYRFTQFLRADVAIFSKYFFHNPFKETERFVRPVVYGETPIFTMAQIAKVLEIKPSDHVVDLGCGRGRACFWLNIVKGCKVTGIEFVPMFVSIAKNISQKLNTSGLNFECEDFLEANLDYATIIYLYGTCMEAKEIKQLSKKFSELKSGVRIVTVSFSLLNFKHTKADFRLLQIYSAPFSWGNADIYIHEKL